MERRLYWRYTQAGKLEKYGDELRGWAHPHFDAPTFVRRVARLTARRITCGAAQ